jgi:putative transposase
MGRYDDGTADGTHSLHVHKLMPPPEQERALEIVVWRCRERYNAGVQERGDAWEKCHGSVNFTRQSAERPDIKEIRPEYRDINAQVLQDVLHRREKAFAAFLRRVKAGEKPGYPRFLGKQRYTSFTYSQMGEHGGATLDGKHLPLAKMGRIHLRLHRAWGGLPKTATMIREADGWYAAISCADVPLQPLPTTQQRTGSDGGLKGFRITSQGAPVENPRHYRRAERELNKAQRRVSRRKKGSTRRRQAVQRLARKHPKVQRQRPDVHHKTARALLRAFDSISLEDVQVANMVRTPHLAKSIRDAGWAQFRTILEGKAVYASRRVVAVPPAYTSQDCSGCGARVEKSLSVRTHVCTSCGLILDRDENAARTIKGAGQALQALTAALAAVA